MIGIAIIAVLITLGFIWFKINIEYFIVSMIVLSIFAIIRHREKIQKEKLKNALESGKENLQYNVKSIRDKYREVKENSPFLIVVIAKIVFLIWLINNVDSDVFINYLFIFVISMFIVYKMVEYLLDFKVFSIIDLEKKTFEVRKISYRLSSKYKILDDADNESVLTIPFKTKFGNGFFANSIDRKNRIIKANILHNNVNVVDNLIKQHLELRKFSYETKAENHKLIAGYPKRLMIESTKIFEESNVQGKLAISASKKSFVENEKTYEEDLREELEKKE